MWSARVFTWTVVIIATTDLANGGCHQKFKAIPGHSACLNKSPKVSASGISASEKTEITRLHNTYRQKVKNALYMHKVTWDDEVAMVAKKWAENCNLNHDQNSARFIPGRFSVGQNIAMGAANSKRNWASIVDLWYKEETSFTYGGPNQPGQVGHYTQLVWADTYLVGCGFALCGNTPFYVCDYGPSGNIGQYDKPYQSGTSTRLVDCGGISCYGDRKLTQSCTCDCDSKLLPAFTGGNTCQLNCGVQDVSTTCGPRGTYKQSDCAKTFVTFYCPHMCKTCPYADPSYSKAAGNIRSQWFLSIICLISISLKAV